tara:strand:- start:220 stop:582 length:363 start_codon:yes stop_codon:yes gene_type:complete
MDLKQIDVKWKKLMVYLLLLYFLLISSTALAQTKVICFNAEWNKANNVEWFDKLKDIKKETMDITVGDCQKKYQIAIVPTIIVFKDGEEVKRYQADLSFKMVATRKEIQDYINDLIMSDF